MKTAFEHIEKEHGFVLSRLLWEGPNCRTAFIDKSGRRVLIFTLDPEELALANQIKEGDLWKPTPLESQIPEIEVVGSEPAVVGYTFHENGEAPPTKKRVTMPYYIIGFCGARLKYMSNGAPVKTHHK